MPLDTPLSSDISSGFLEYAKEVAWNIQTQTGQVRGNLEAFTENQLKRHLDSLQSYRIQLPALTELLWNHIQSPIPLQWNESREEIESNLSLELKIISAYSGAILRSENLPWDVIPESALTNLMCIDYEIADMHMRSIRNESNNLTHNLHDRAITLL